MRPLRSRVGIAFVRKAFATAICFPGPIVGPVTWAVVGDHVLAFMTMLWRSSHPMIAEKSRIHAKS